MEGFDASAYGRAIADVYDEMVEHLPTGPAVERVAVPAEGGEHRWAGWSGAPFTHDSRAHVSVYRLLET